MDFSIDMMNIKTITYRGIVCIDTFPLELVWGKTHTVLECNNCLSYATFKNVLVGLCKNCAIYSYNGKYGNGFYNYPYSDVTNSNISYCFGDIHPLHIIHIEGLEYPQKAVNNFESYSIYNLSLVSNNELSLLLTNPFNIYSLYYFQHYYNCDIEVLHMIIDKIKEHKMSFNIWSSKYYNECLAIEKFYKVITEDYKIKNENDIDSDSDSNEKIKYPCSYCNTYKLKKELKKCSNCHNVKYCGVACQSRDWKIVHKLKCKDNSLENSFARSSISQESLIRNPILQNEGESGESGESDDTYNYDDYDYEN